LFRIDRKHVNLATTRRVHFTKENDPEAGAEDESLDAAASAAFADFIEDEEDVFDPVDHAAAMAALEEEIIAGAETEAKVKAGKIIDEAQEQAAKITEEARVRAEEEFNRARQEGFDEGAEEGRRSYDEKIAEKIEQDNETLKRVLDEIYEERERTYSELEEEVTNLAIDIVKKIINPADEALGDVFISQIKNALRQMSTDNKIIIRVGPVEYERFFSTGAAAIELDSGVTVNAAVIRDISLGEGDLIIDTDDVTINAGLDSQLQYVKLAFERANQYEPD